MHEVLVCDPDEKSFEASALGLLYTATSRGTTLGDDDGRNSAVYFTGAAMKPERIRRLTFKPGKPNEEFELAKKRRYWNNYLQARKLRMRTRINEVMVRSKSLFTWAHNTTFTYDDLYHRIQLYTSR